REAADRGERRARRKAAKAERRATRGGWGSVPGQRGARRTIHVSWRPLVTVVVPIYNAERFLRECIESVLAQEYGVWELMLVDDGSTDSSATVARGFAAARADRIHFLRHDGGINRGSSATRNLGVRH